MAGDGEGRAVIGLMKSSDERARPSRPQRSKAMVATFSVALAKSKALLSDWLQRFLQARKRRTEQEREFYRDLGAYCRANNLSPICEDDWKSAAYVRNDDRIINAKGDVLWTKVNLPR
jgi:hypothetical protein